MTLILVGVSLGSRGRKMEVKMSLVFNLHMLTFSSASFKVGIGCSRGVGSGKRGHIRTDLEFSSEFPSED